MSNQFDGLPPLPEPKHRGPDGTGSYFDSYTADQVREAQRTAVLAEREAIATQFENDGWLAMAGEAIPKSIAAAIRARA